MTSAWETLISEVPRNWWYRYLAIPIGIALLTLPWVAYNIAAYQTQWRKRFLLILTAQIPASLVFPTTLIAWKHADALGWFDIPLQHSLNHELLMTLDQLVSLALLGVGLTIPLLTSWTLLGRNSGMRSAIQRMTKTFTAVSTRVVGMRRGAIIEAAPFGVLAIQSGIRNGMIEVVRANAIIGTHGDIALPDESVSRRHAQLHIHNNIVMISDLGSRNGTFLNRDRQIVPIDNRFHPLQSGDQLILGDPVSASAVTLTYRQEER